MTLSSRSVNSSNTVDISTFAKNDNPMKRYDLLTPEGTRDLLFDEPHKSKNFIEEN